MLLEARNIEKKFGKVKAVDGISFHIKEGEVLGFLGPNGAGKTTTIHMLLGLVTPDDGEVFVFGKNLRDYSEEILQKMNFTSPYVGLPYRLSVRENLMVFAGLYNVQNPSRKIQELLKLFEIEHLKNTPVVKLSAGESSRLGLCKAFLNDPSLLLLDEPTASLDPHMSRQSREILMKAHKKSGMSILWTSHNMAEIEKVCDRVIFLNHGKIIAEGSPIEITNAILKEERKEPDLEEVFSRVANEVKVS